MIITCINCNKKFDINSDLIPKNGRLLECSSCNHQWFFKIEKEYWSILKTFLVFLNRIPDFPKTGLDAIEIHKEANVILNSI